MKIFIGFTEIANFTNNYKLGFEAMGHKTFTVVTKTNIYYPNAKYDVVLSNSFSFLGNSNAIAIRILRSLVSRAYTYFVFFKALLTCDIFYYIGGGNMLPFFLDYKLMSLLKKKLVVVFLGSEIRHWFLYKKEAEILGYSNLFATSIEAYRNQKFNSFFDKKNRVVFAEKYASLILSQGGLAQLQKKPYHRVEVGLNIDNYSYNIPGRDIPLIIHAPSSRGVKGTEFVFDVIAKLEKEGIKFKFELIEKMKNSDLLNLLSHADIVVDELNSDTIGVLSTEAMATGNAVLTSYVAEWAKVPLPCPVLNTNRYNLYENLKELILNKDKRMKLAREGIKYVRTNNDIRKIIQRHLSILEKHNGEYSFDFIPNLDFETSLPSDVLREEKIKFSKTWINRFKS